MRRGDIVLAVLQGDLGKPRPAVIVQADELGPDRLTIIICPMSSAIATTDTIRPVVQPSDENGLRTASLIMTDKIIAVRRERLRSIVGRLSAEDRERLDDALLIVLGLGR